MCTCSAKVLFSLGVSTKTGKSHTALCESWMLQNTEGIPRLRLQAAGLRFARVHREWRALLA